MLVASPILHSLPPVPHSLHPPLSAFVASRSSHPRLVTHSLHLITHSSYRIPPSLHSLHHQFTYPFGLVLVIFLWYLVWAVWLRPLPLPSEKDFGEHCHLWKLSETWQEPEGGTVFPFVYVFYNLCNFTIVYLLVHSFLIQKWYSVFTFLYFHTHLVFIFISIQRVC